MKTTTHLLALATACSAALFAVAEDPVSAPTTEEMGTSAEAASSSAEAAAPSDETESSFDKNNAGKEGLDRYQSIIDRQPFGPPPPGFDPSMPASQAGGANGADGKTEAEISAEEQKIMSSVRVSILNVTPGGSVMVGFTDSTMQPPVNYYLKVGDTSTDGAKWTVKDADPATGMVSLSKDGIDVTLAVGGETKKDSSAKSSAKNGRPFAAGGPRGSRGIPSGRGLGPTPGLGRPPGFGPPPISGGEGTDNAHGNGGALARLHQKRMLRRAEEDAQRQDAEKARAEMAAEVAKEKEELAREREQAAAEREQTREQLKEMQEALRKVREAKAAQNAEESSEEQPE